MGYSAKVFEILQAELFVEWFAKLRDPMAQAKLMSVFEDYHSTIQAMCNLWVLAYPNFVLIRDLATEFTT